MAETDGLAEIRERLIEAVLEHVAFDGWTQTALDAALAETGTERGLGRLAFPRGGIDMALGFHRLMDRRLASDLAAKPQPVGTTDRIRQAVIRRLELVVDHRDAVRRGATMLALPHNAPEGARAIWETADLIWTASGDTSTDYNWYSKRAILASVYSATVLYWLGDMDPEFSATRGFLDRRLEDVGRFEKTKAQLRDNPLARAMMWGPNQVLGMIRAPGTTAGPGGYGAFRR